MQTGVSIEDGLSLLRLPGRFVFSACRGSGLALGMLLMLRDEAASMKKPFDLAHAQASVGQVLGIASFGKSFRIV